MNRYPTEGMYNACRGLLTLDEPRMKQARDRARKCLAWKEPDLRPRLAQAVEASLQNHRAYPFDRLSAKYSLPISVYTFRKAKQAYCQAMLVELFDETKA